ncbi:MAG: DUF3108 domain-containing protein, partial [Calditrichales bacterium]
MRKSTASINRYGWIRILSVAFILIFCCQNKIMASSYGIPFASGEKLTFQLSWGFIPAGEAVLEVMPIKTIDGIQSYHFVLTARSNPFVDVFYKVRDRIDAYVDLNMTRSLLYKKEQHEGSTKRDVVVNFNWDNHTAQYFNFNKMEKTIAIIPGSFDPLSVFFYSRLLDLKVDEMVTSPVTDGKKCIIGKAKIVKKEKISLASGIY